jgi:hypothetical protein
VILVLGRVAVTVTVVRIGMLLRVLLILPPIRAGALRERSEQRAPEEGAYQKGQDQPQPRLS